MCPMLHIITPPRGYAIILIGPSATNKLTRRKEGLLRWQWALAFGMEVGLSLEANLMIQ